MPGVGHPAHAAERRCDRRCAADDLASGRCAADDDHPPVERRREQVQREFAVQRRRELAAFDRSIDQPSPVAPTLFRDAVVDGPHLGVSRRLRVKVRQDSADQRMAQGCPESHLKLQDIGGKRTSVLVQGDAEAESFDRVAGEFDAGRPASIDRRLSRPGPRGDIFQADRGETPLGPFLEQRTIERFGQIRPWNGSSRRAPRFLYVDTIAFHPNRRYGRYDTVPFIQRVTMIDKFDSFSNLLRKALGPRLAQADDILGLFAEDVVFEFPYAPQGLPRRLEGRQALADHLVRLGPLLDLGALSLHSVHPSGNTVIVEFSCAGKHLPTGAAYDQDYISVISLRSGRIAHYRDYWNPSTVLSAFGGSDAAVASFDGESARG